MQRSENLHHLHLKEGGRTTSEYQAEHHIYTLPKNPHSQFLFNAELFEYIGNRHIWHTVSGIVQPKGESSGDTFLSLLSIVELPDLLLSYFVPSFIFQLNFIIDGLSPVSPEWNDTFGQHSIPDYDIQYPDHFLHDIVTSFASSKEFEQFRNEAIREIQTFVQFWDAVITHMNASVECLKLFEESYIVLMKRLSAGFTLSLSKHKHHVISLLYPLANITSLFDIRKHSLLNGNALRWNANGPFSISSTLFLDTISKSSFFKSFFATSTADIRHLFLDADFSLYCDNNALADELISRTLSAEERKNRGHNNSEASQLKMKKPDKLYAVLPHPQYTIKIPLYIDAQKVFSKTQQEVYNGTRNNLLNLFESMGTDGFFESESSLERRVANLMDGYNRILTHSKTFMPNPSDDRLLVQVGLSIT